MGLMMSEWKVNKEINVGDVLTMISFMVICVIAAFSLDRRIEKNSLVNDRQTEQIQEIGKQIESNRLEQKQDINRLDTKLDDIKDLIIQDRVR